jgi:hypothetical protein
MKVSVEAFPKVVNEIAAIFGSYDAVIQDAKNK